MKIETTAGGVPVPSDARKTYGLRSPSRQEIDAWTRKRAICAEAQRHVSAWMTPREANREARATAAQRSRGVVRVGPSSVRRRRATPGTGRRLPHRRNRGRTTDGCDAAERRA